MFSVPCVSAWNDIISMHRCALSVRPGNHAWVRCGGATGGSRTRVVPKQNEHRKDRSRSLPRRVLACGAGHAELLVAMRDNINLPRSSCTPRTRGRPICRHSFFLPLVFSSPIVLLVADDEAAWLLGADGL